MSDPEIERIMQQKLRKMVEDATSPPIPEGVIDLNSSTFTDAIANPSPIIVDFWAAWCGPCKMMHPIVDTIAKEYRGRVRIARLNIDQSQAIAQRLRVQSIPTFISFSEGREVSRVTGAVGADGLRRLASNLLG